MRRLAQLIAAVAFALAAAAQEHRLALLAGRSVVLDSPSEIRQISTNDPAIVDAVAVSSKEVMLHAKAAGTATVVIWSQDGSRAVYNVAVEQDLEPLRHLLRQTFPGETITVHATRDALALTGNVSSKDVADRAAALAAPFGAKATVNNLVVAAPPPVRQVLLRVKFAELNRKAAQSFGVNILSTGAGNVIGGASTQQFSAPQLTELTGRIGGKLGGTTSEFTISDVLNVFAFRPDLNLGAFIRALEAQNPLQILAEPNLVTVEGKEASFLVGGEFPIPILQSGGTLGAVTVQFRDFGIRLSFTPVFADGDRIRMHVKPEVLSIDLANSVSVSGFMIPALATRRMETNVELQLGQSFAIAGLIDNRATESLSKIPGLSAIPLLGTLFKSKDIAKNQTELIVIVTPELADPARPLPSGPAAPLEFLKPFPKAQEKPAQEGGASGR